VSPIERAQGRFRPRGAVAFTLLRACGLLHLASTGLAPGAEMQTGAFFEGCWLDFATLTVELEPTHFPDVPPDPPLA
jgi:hypothetical protein